MDTRITFKTRVTAGVAVPTMANLTDTEVGLALNSSAKTGALFVRNGSDIYTIGSNPPIVPHTWTLATAVTGALPPMLLCGKFKLQQLSAVVMSGTGSVTIQWHFKQMYTLSSFSIEDATFAASNQTAVTLSNFADYWKDAGNLGYGLTPGFTHGAVAAAERHIIYPHITAVAGTVTNLAMTAFVQHLNEGVL